MSGNDSMTPEQERALEREFHACLLAKVAEARQLTRIGTGGLWQDLKSAAGLKTARKLLVRRYTGEYFGGSEADKPTRP